MQVQIVDGDQVRKEHDPEFGLCARQMPGRPYSALYVPEGVLWVERVVADEVDLFRRLTELEDEYLNPGADFRQFRAWVNKQLCTNDLDLEGVTSVVEERSGLRIRFLDGGEVRKCYDAYFSWGGHDLVYGRYIPKGEVWIDQKMPKRGHQATVVHEVVERRLMNIGLTYDDAHDYATAADRQVRRSQGFKFPGDECDPPELNLSSSTLCQILDLAGV